MGVGFQKLEGLRVGGTSALKGKLRGWLRAGRAGGFLRLSSLRRSGSREDGLAPGGEAARSIRPAEHLTIFGNI